jgi:hypothetical protein
MKTIHQLTVQLHSQICLGKPPVAGTIAEEPKP